VPECYAQPHSPAKQVSSLRQSLVSRDFTSRIYHLSYSIAAGIHLPLLWCFLSHCGSGTYCSRNPFCKPECCTAAVFIKVKGACVVCVGIALAQRSCTALLGFETRAPHHFRQVRDNGPPPCCTMGMKWSSRVEEQPFPPRCRRRRWRLNLPTFGAVCGNVKRHGSIATGQNRGARTARNNFDLHQHGNAKAQWFENAIPERDRGDRICVDAIRGISSRTGF
jgi:hypothetical protein